MKISFKVLVYVRITLKDYQDALVSYSQAIRLNPKNENPPYLCKKISNVSENNRNWTRYKKRKIILKKYFFI